MYNNCNDISFFFSWMQYFHVEAAWRDLGESSFRPLYGLAVGLLCEQEGCQHVSVNKKARLRYWHPNTSD